MYIGIHTRARPELVDCIRQPQPFTLAFLQSFKDEQKLNIYLLKRLGEADDHYYEPWVSKGQAKVVLSKGASPPTLHRYTALYSAATSTNELLLPVVVVGVIPH